MDLFLMFEDNEPSYLVQMLSLQNEFLNTEL